jgi:hypothetical protein
MTFIAFLISLAVLYGFLLLFLSELTKAEAPENVLLQMPGEGEPGEQSAAA